MIDYREKYKQMKLRAASYSMGICAMIRKVGGNPLLRSILDLAAEHSGTRRATTLKGETNPQNALAMDLTHMLEEFDTPKVNVVNTGESVKIENPYCGCICPFTSQADKFGFTEEETRHYVCRRCIPSYKASAENLELDFKGKLTEEGCWMQFSKKNEQ